MNKRMVEKENEFAKGNAGRNKSREKREEKVRELLRENPEYTSKQIAEIIGVSDATIRGYEAWKNRRLNVETT
nr:MAG TPA: Transcriptional regulatory protein RcsB factor, DNA BINDING PROTEIN.6A [Bacteriophage sp.]